MKDLCVVVGAGLAGAASARLLAESGEKVLVVEKLHHMAGHAHDAYNEDGILVHTYGPHIFHTKSAYVFRYLSKFTRWNHYQHRVLSYADGMLVNFPINRDTIEQLFGAPLTTAEVEEFLKREVESSEFNTPAENFEDAVISQVGRRLYEKFFMNYTRKQWNRDPKEISADVARRIPTRSSRDGRYFSDPYQGLPLGGYTAMVEKMLDHENISVLLNCDYFDIAEEFDPKLTVYTGPLDEYFGKSHGSLEYRSLRIVFETLHEEKHQPAAVVNYPNDYDWTRVTEFKQMTGQKSDLTTICYEYPLDHGEPYYVVMSEENMKKRDAYMKEVGKLEETQKFMFIGRLAEYKYYNMDEVVGRSLERTKAWLKKNA